MLSDDLVAAFLALSLALVLVRAIYEFQKSRRGQKTALEEAESDKREPLIFLSAILVVVFYLEMTLYVVWVLATLPNVTAMSQLQLRFPFDSYVQILGFAMMIFGYIVVFLGLYAVDHDVLVTSGAYHYVRHPQYLGYFIVFGGFFLLLLNFIALIPLLSIPGEVRMATIEEGFLARRFGDRYVSYKRFTGKFFPKVRHRGRRSEG
ncbi:MAG TPA: methyltransferase [Candidatus Acidoferrum sp.]|nr:methyltransferase [Candidatus Acidoferrum sp.]